MFTDVYRVNDGVRADWGGTRAVRDVQLMSIIFIDSRYFFFFATFPTYFQTVLSFLTSFYVSTIKKNKKSTNTYEKYPESKFYTPCVSDKTPIVYKFFLIVGTNRVE